MRERERERERERDRQTDRQTGRQTKRQRDRVSFLCFLGFISNLFDIPDLKKTSFV